MAINKTDLLTKLTSIISDYTSGSTVASDVLLNALSIDSLNDISIIEVDDSSYLPNLLYHSSPSGMVYFMQKEYIFAISSGTKWLTLDGKLIRQDTTINTAYAWGCNSSGQLGDNTATNRCSPVSVVGGFTDWCQVSAGGNGHTLAINAGGALRAWGRGTNGRLGDNAAVSRSSPVSVVGGFIDWCQVSAGFFHSLGVRTNGTAWAWGYNNCGQLGDGTSVTKSSPIVVLGGFTDWCQVSGGWTHSAGIRTNGTAWAWGSNVCGTLGDNTVVSKSSPVSVVGGFTDWCQISVGCVHSVGVRTNGTIWSWGANGSGQLGDGTSVAKSSPVSVIGGFTDWCQVSAGSFVSLGVRTNGTAWGWGTNTFGRLGDGTTTNSSSPVSVVGGFTDWCQVSAGLTHSLGLRTNGTLWAWGSGGAGALGDGTTTSKTSPVSVVGGFTDWAEVSAGENTIGLRVT